MRGSPFLKTGGSELFLLKNGWEWVGVAEVDESGWEWVRVAGSAIR